MLGTANDGESSAVYSSAVFISKGVFFEILTIPVFCTDKCTIETMEKQIFKYVEILSLLGKSDCTER